MAFLQKVEDSSAGVTKSGTDGLGTTLGDVGDLSSDVGKNVGDLASAPVGAALQSAEKAKEGLGMMALYLNMPYELVAGAVVSLIVAFAVAVFATGASSAVIRGAVLVTVFLGWAAAMRILFLRKMAETEKKMI